MLHILTKSDLILTQIDKLKEMKQMVQIEVSFASQDDTMSRSIEFFTPTVTKRLELVEELAKAGLFVRVMAMPFYGERKDLLVLRDETFKRGAKAFKNKGLNYYSWDDLAKLRTWDQYLDEKIPRTKGRSDTKDESIIVKSGEYVLVNGRARRKTVSMPRMDEEFIAKSDWSALTKKRWRFTKRSMKVIDCGYRECNSVDWGYVT
jgi:DNA repair photolyase